MTASDPSQVESLQSQPKYFAIKLFAKATALALALAVGMLTLTAGILGVFLYHKATIFAQYSGKTMPELKQIITTTLKTKPITTDGHKTILLLGTDEVANRVDAPILTDAILLISINTTTGKISTLALPRDLWSEAYQTKINALLHYGITRYPNSPDRFPTEVIQELTGVPIHHTITLKLNQVAEIIDLLGGVEVTVSQPFIDSLYPKEDVDISKENDPTVLYRTVEFEAGTQVLTGSRALEYMRSRHSTDEQGTDGARSERQQAVLSAVLTQLSSLKTIADLKKSGTLFAYYEDTFAHSLPTQELLSTAFALFDNKDSLSLTQTSPTIETIETPGVIFHPKETKKQPQWIYQIKDPTLFKAFAQKSLDIPTQER
jgi:LCP family protein required for cell wall assembly